MAELSANAQLVDGNGRPTRIFLAYLNSIASSSTGSLQTQLTALAARMTDAENDITALEGAVVAHTAQIAALGNRLAALEVLSLRAPVWP